MVAHGTPVPVQYNIVDRDAYMQHGIHNVESSSVRHHTKTRPPADLISSAQLGSLAAAAAAAAAPGDTMSFKLRKFSVWKVW
jgi:hypothetical protein